MKVIPPLDLFASSRITSSTISMPSGNDPALAWSSATTYNEGDTVYRPNNKIYESISPTPFSSVTNPETDVLSITPKWVEVGYVNKYAMFDTSRNTVTSATTTMTVVLTPGLRVNSLALMSMTNVTSVTISATSGGSPIFPLSPATGIYTGSPLTSLVIFDIPPIINIVITITIAGSGTISCGGLVLGTATFIGDVQSNISLTTENFSTVTRDTFGNITLLPRRSVPKTSQQLFLLAPLVDKVKELRDELNAKVAVWCGMENSEVAEYYDSILIFGFYRTFSIELTNSIHAMINLELEEI